MLTLWSGVVAWPLLLKGGLGWEMLGDISYHKATLQSEGKHSIHIHIHMLTVVRSSEALREDDDCLMRQLERF